MNRATPAKLRNGDWGARVTGQKPEPGDLVTVASKTGKTWVETIERVIATFDNDGTQVHLCALVAKKTRAASSGCTCTCEHCLHCANRGGMSAHIPF